MNHGKGRKQRGNGMGKILKGAKFRAYGMMVLVFLVFGGLLLAFHLHKQLVLPSKGWSRSVTMPLHIKGEYAPSKNIVRKEGGRYHFYTYRKNGITDLTFDSQLKVIGKSKIPVKIHTDTPFWAKGRTVLALKNHKLILFRQGKQQIVTGGVSGMEAIADKVVFWKKQNLYQINLHTFSFQKIGELNGKVQTIVLKRGTNDFLAVQQMDDTHVRPYLFVPGDGGRYHSVSLFSIKGDSVSGFDFALSKNRLMLTYSVTNKGNGGLVTKNYLATVNLDKTEAGPITRGLNVYDQVSHNIIKDPSVDHIFFRNGRPMLLLSGMSHLPTGEQAENVLIAKRNPTGKWMASPVSATKEPSEHPFMLNDHTVMWFDFVSFNQWVLEGASENPQVIAKTEHLNGNDWVNGVSNSIMGLVGAFFLLAFACLWVAPAGIFYAFMFIRFTKITENDPAWIKYVTAGLYFVMQLIFIQRIFTGSFAHLAPQYLRFPESHFVIPAVLILLSWGAANFVKGREWGNLAQLAYLIGVNLWMMMLLVGPYMI